MDVLVRVMEGNLVIQDFRVVNTSLKDMKMDLGKHFPGLEWKTQESPPPTPILHFAEDRCSGYSFFLFEVSADTRKKNKPFPYNLIESFKN